MHETNKRLSEYGKWKNIVLHLIFKMRIKEMETIFCWTALKCWKMCNSFSSFFFHFLLLFKILHTIFCMLCIPHWWMMTWKWRKQIEVDDRTRMLIWLFSSYGLWVCACLFSCCFFSIWSYRARIAFISMIS